MPVVKERLERQAQFLDVVILGYPERGTEGDVGYSCGTGQGVHAPQEPQSRSEHTLG